MIWPGVTCVGLVSYVTWIQFPQPPLQDYHVILMKISINAACNIRIDNKTNILIMIKIYSFHIPP